MALIGIDARSLYLPKWNGISKYVADVLHGILRLSSHQFQLYYEQELPEKPFALSDRVRDRRFSEPAYRFHLWEQACLPWFLRKDRLQLFHAPANYLPYVRACPTVLTLHDVILSQYDEDESPAMLRYWRKVMPHCIRRADRIITVSDYSRRDIVRIIGVEEEKVRVIHRGRDEFFHVLSEAERNVPADGAELPEHFIFLLGPSSPRKNVVRAVEAFIEYKRRENVPVKLVMTVSLPALKAEVQVKLKANGLQGEAILLDYVSRELLRLIYNRASLFIYPSLHEGFGLPILEAMACGAPVATSNASCLPEIAGDAAVLFDPLDPAAIAGAISRVMGDSQLAGALRLRSLERAGHFSWQKEAQQTLAVYEEVLGRD